MNTLNGGAVERPLASGTSLVSHDGRCVPSYGDPPRSTNVGLAFGLDAGTVTPPAVTAG